MQFSEILSSYQYTKEFLNGVYKRGVSWRVPCEYDSEGKKNSSSALQISVVGAGQYIDKNRYEINNRKFDTKIEELSLLITNTYKAENGKIYGYDRQLTPYNISESSYFLIVKPDYKKSELCNLLNNDSVAVDIAKKTVIATNVAEKGYVIGDFIQWWENMSHKFGCVMGYNLLKGTYRVLTAYGETEISYMSKYQHDQIYYANERENGAAIKQIVSNPKYSDVKEWANSSTLFDTDKYFTGKIGDFVTHHFNSDGYNGVIVDYDENKTCIIKDFYGNLHCDKCSPHRRTLVLMNHKDWKEYDKAFSEMDWYLDFKKEHAEEISESAKQVAAEEAVKAEQKAKRLRLAKAKAKAAIAILELMKLGVPPTGIETYSLVGGDKIKPLLAKYSDYRVFTMSGYGWKGKSYGEEPKEPKADFDNRIDRLLNWAAASDVKIDHDKKEFYINSFSIHDME